MSSVLYRGYELGYKSGGEGGGMNTGKVIGPGV